MRALCRAIAPLGVRFSAEMRADRLDEGLLDELAAAGLRSLEIGVESANRAMLAREKRKPPEHAQIERVVREAQRRGVRVICNYVLGMPDDDEATMRETIAWAARLDSFAVQFTIATPYPGTTLEPRARARAAARAGRRPHRLPPDVRAPARLPERLAALREEAYVGYYFRPRYALRFARSAAAALLD
ncbi:MAG: radical SAM protein [Sandaracinaceae bacterium]|nr:radical SAM protein [Sandaracinaceae bacterium]